MWWTLILAGVLVLLVLLIIVWAASRSSGSALARRPLVVRRLDRSLVLLSGHPRTYVDPAEATARADVPAAAAFKGWLRLAGDSYHNARDSSKPIEVYLVRRSQPPRSQPKSRLPGHLEWMVWLTSVPCLEPGFQPPGPPPPVDRDGCDEYLFLDASSGSQSAEFGTRAGEELFSPA